MDCAAPRIFCERWDFYTIVMAYYFLTRCKPGYLTGNEAARFVEGLIPGEISGLTAQDRDGFDVRRPGELVDRQNRFDPVTAICQDPQVARQRCRIA